MSVALSLFLSLSFYKWFVLAAGFFSDTPPPHPPPQVPHRTPLLNLAVPHTYKHSSFTQAFFFSLIFAFFPLKKKSSVFPSFSLPLSRSLSQSLVCVCERAITGTGLGVEGCGRRGGVVGRRVAAAGTRRTRRPPSVRRGQSPRASACFLALSRRSAMLEFLLLLLAAAATAAAAEAESAREAIGSPKGGGGNIR